MKIIVATAQALFVKGGAEFLTENLCNALIHAGHQVEIVNIPFMDRPLEIIEDQMIAARLMEISASWAGRTDLCIGLKFPSYYIPHPNKVLWVLHQHRAAYDLFDTPYSNIKNDDVGNAVRNLIMNGDNRYLPEAERIYTIAKNVSKRLEKYNGIPSTPLYHPCPGMEQFYCEQYEEYILMPSRITQAKRQYLALEALAETKTKVMLYILGKADHEAEKKKLDVYIEEHHLQDRVRFLDFVPQEEKVRLYANAKAVLFIPKDEDYGYITLEAMAASKPVITATDSGGPLEFVVQHENGIIAEPNASAIAEAMDRMWSSRTMPREYGQRARKRLDEMEITWDRVVKELIGR
ncbi:MAG: glycosyltransferase family 4 protein [Bacteroides sp.]|nr:glycosyltransferase family 4 protein [Bacteroides sp.]MCM1548405.1 glycosyltransferase family 4 protein [Clostridium sp.]